MPSSRKSRVLSLSIAQGILMLVFFVSGIVFARTLTVTDYGTYLQTFLAYEFAVPLLTLGLPSALFYFLPGAKERQKGLVLENMLLLLMAGTIFSLFLILGGTELLAKLFQNPDLAKTLPWMIFYPLYTFPVVVGAILVIKDKVNLNAIYNTITGLILAVALIISTIVTRSYEAPTIVRILLPLFFFPVVIYLSFKYVPGKWNKPNFSSMWKMLKFAVPLGLASVLGTLTSQLAKLVVSFLCTPEEFAIFANGAKEVPFVSIITGSIAVVIMADMSQKYKEGDLKSALEIFRKAALMSACLLLPIMVFLFLYADSLIDVIYTNKYMGSVLPFRIYLFFLPIRIIYYGSAFIALGKSKAILFRTAISLVLTAILSYFLTKQIGFVGAAIALVIEPYLWEVPYNLITLGKEFGCKPLYIIPLKKLGHVLLLSLTSGLIASSFLFFNLSTLIALSLGAITFSIAYFILSYLRIPEFKEMTSPILMKFITRKIK